jgi:hypothetical protein
MRTASPSAINALPAAAREVYSAAVSAALHPVFVVAAIISVLAFALTWLLRETPLRATVRPLDGEEFAGAAAEEEAVAVRRA